MTIFAALLLTVLAFAFVVYPLFRQRSRPTAVVEDEKQRELSSRRDTTYAMLKELEFDYQSGLLTEDDYRDMSARYKGKAIAILKDLDNTAKDTSVEDGIEEQVLQVRQDQGQFCPQCGAKAQTDDHFCSHCDTGLRQEKKID